MLTVGCLLSCAMAWSIRPATAADSPNQFNLTIGDKTYSVTEGQPFTVDGPNGTTVPAMLKTKAVLTYHQHGLTFNYPKEVRESTSVDGELGLVSLNLDTTGNYLMVIESIHSVESPDAMKTSVEEAVLGKYKSMGG